ncbi:MAG: RNA polymerase-binding protein DksA [Pseudomonadaceae bacterium]|nr:RNA polymerase-binding protein DksA [Pseudomonadaceae bacterium]
MAKLKIDSLEPLTDAPAKTRGYPDKYDPLKDKEYMGTAMLSYFRDILLTQRKELVDGNREAINDLQQNSSIEADLADQATLELDQMLELKNRDRARKLINKIDETLDLIRNGDYGFCAETGDEIGVKRMLARPTATLSIEAKNRQEKKEEAYAG